MNRQNPILLNLLGPAVAAMGYELWGLELLARGRRSLLRVYVDREGGVTVADCERVSRQLTGVLDVEDPIRGPYDLEVSSPGMDRLLFNLDHFRRYTGHEIRVRLTAKLEGRRQISGRIGEVGGDSVSILEGEKQYSIPADMIEKARLIPQF